MSMGGQWGSQGLAFSRGGKDEYYKQLKAEHAKEKTQMEIDAQKKFHEAELAKQKLAADYDQQMRTEQAKVDNSMKG